MKEQDRIAGVVSGRRIVCGQQNKKSSKEQIARQLEAGPRSRGIVAARLFCRQGIGTGGTAPAGN